MVGQRRELVGEPPRLVAEQPGDPPVEDPQASAAKRSVSPAPSAASTTNPAPERDGPPRPDRRAARPAGARGCRPSRGRSCRCRGPRCGLPAPPRRRRTRPRCGSPCRRCRGRGCPRRPTRVCGFETLADARSSTTGESRASRSTSRNRQTATMPWGVTVPRASRSRRHRPAIQGSLVSSTALRRAAYSSLACLGGEDVDHPTGVQRLGQRLRALGEEEPVLGPAVPTGEPPCRSDASTLRGEGTVDWRARHRRCARRQAEAGVLRPRAGWPWRSRLVQRRPARR